MSCMSTCFYYVIYVDMKNFGNYKTIKTTTKFQSWELTNRLLLIHSKVYTQAIGIREEIQLLLFIPVFCQHTLL